MAAAGGTAFTTDSSCAAHWPQPSWNPIFSCASRSASDQCNTRAVYFVFPGPASSNVSTAVMKGLSDGSHALTNASVKTRRSFFTTSRYTPALGKSFPCGSRITTMLVPPGRTSICASDVDQGLGANHCLRISGSVHAWYTFSRGALIIRVRTNSRFEAAVALAEADEFSTVAEFELMWR